MSCTLKLVLLAAVALSSQLAVARPSADAIYTGGPIVTMVDAAPTAEAVAIRSGRIVAVGQRAEVMRLVGAQTRVVDLAGKALLPGFFDPHGHVVGVGLQAVSANLLPPPDGEGRDIASLQRILRDWIARNRAFIDKYGLIIGFGYDDSQLRERRHPSRRDLDAVSNEFPVLLMHQSGHLGAVNSKALEKLGITAATTDPAGGAYRREEASREPNGVLEETAFFQALGTFMAVLDEPERLDMIRAGADFYAKFGYTTAQEGRASSESAGDLAKAGAAGLLKLDVLIYPDILSARSAIKPPLLSRSYVDHVRIGGGKLTIDGSPQGKTAWLTQPYLVPPPGREKNYRGYPAIDPDQAKAAVDTAFANHWQIICHANGDAAADLFIAAVRASTEKYGRADRRPVLIHAQVLREDQLDALKELGIIPSFFPMHTYYWGDWHRDSVLGPERAARISPTGSALRRGMRFTTHHDAPVANPDSMRVLSATVTRRTRSGAVLGPDQRVSVDVALKAMTLWAAYQHFEEDSKGSIEVGKLADFVVLSQDPRAVAPEQLEHLQVVTTIKEGRVVYASAD